MNTILTWRQFFRRSAPGLGAAALFYRRLFAADKPPVADQDGWAKITEDEAAMQRSRRTP